MPLAQKHNAALGLATNDECAAPVVAVVSRLDQRQLVRICIRRGPEAFRIPLDVVDVGELDLVGVRAGPDFSQDAVALINIEVESAADLGIALSNSFCLGAGVPCTELRSTQRAARRLREVRRNNGY
ncbi:hypothetical protein [Thauera humireducens]|uniref:hypothetical protein n=1 Tax=Thauera humireducens TaxID=1134435 RepID=UPI0024A8A0A3|nr:hypothetical protein [Thauera humireducens]